MKLIKLSSRASFAAYCLFLVATFALIVWVFFLQEEIPESIIRNTETWAIK